METIYCANECIAEAVRVISHPNGRRTPLCANCARAYQWGQANPASEMYYIGDLYLVKQENGTWAEVCRECGYIQDETTPLCQACGEEA